MDHQTAACLFFGSTRASHCAHAFSIFAAENAAFGGDLFSSTSIVPALLALQAVKEVTRLFEDTPADSYQPPSTRTSSETNLSSSNDAYSETWEAESDGEFMDVSDWTHKQVSGAYQHFTNGYGEKVARP